MKRLLLSLLTLMFFCLQIAAQGAGKWKKDYFEDEFGDKLMNQPYYQVYLKAEGKGTFGDMIWIRVSNVYGIEFDGRLTQMMGIRIKTSDGKIHNIPYDVTANRTYKVADQYTQTVFNILSKGNFSIALVGGGTNADGNIHETLSARVYDETKGIEKYFPSQSSNPKKSAGNQQKRPSLLGKFFSGNVGKNAYDCNFLKNAELSRRISKLMGQTNYNNFIKHQLMAGNIGKYDNSGKYGLNILDRDDQYLYYIIYDSPKDNLSIIVVENGFGDSQGKYYQEKQDADLINNFSDESFY